MVESCNKQACLRSPLIRLVARVVLVAAVPAILIAGLAFAQDYSSIPWEGEVPANALQAGESSAGQPVYVCVVDSWGGEHPGALGSDGICRVAWGGRGHAFKDDFQVLVAASASDTSWVEAGAGEQVKNAFRAGDDDGPIYVCRVQTTNGLLPGKLRDDGWCYVAADGDELTFTEGYEVLVD